MSNIDTTGTRQWGDRKPPRSSLTAIANQITQIRHYYNEEFRRLIAGPGGSLHAFRLRHEEDQAIGSAIRRYGWTFGTLEAELLRRTTKRWARKIIHGWF